MHDLVKDVLLLSESFQFHLNDAVNRSQYFYGWKTISLIYESKYNYSVTHFYLNIEALSN